MDRLVHKSPRVDCEKLWSGYYGVIEHTAPRLDVIKSLYVI